MGRENLDAIALATSHDEAWVETFFIRQGNLVGRDHFIMQGTRDSSNAEIVGQFVQQFYDSASYIPRTVLVPEPIEESEVLESWLSGRRDGPVARDATAGIAPSPTRVDRRFGRQLGDP